MMLIVAWHFKFTIQAVGRISWLWFVQVAQDDDDEQNIIQMKVKQSIHDGEKLVHLMFHLHLSKVTETPFDVDIYLN